MHFQILKLAGTAAQIGADNMSNIAKLAKTIKNPPKAKSQWTLGIVKEISPLKIALYGGEVMASTSDILKITATLSGYKWIGGETVLCLVGKSKIIAVDRVV